MSTEDKYDTLEKIGHGSFGIIRKVRRKNDGFIMCRKEISYLRMSQKEREQLHAEFQILSHLRHPNIVAYYHREHLKQSQDLHLYMEYCGNGDLGRVISDLRHKNQHAQETFVWSIFSQLTMALFRCHYGVDPPEAGSATMGLTGPQVSPKVVSSSMTILHRDLKPENVFLGEDNSVKLGDFGLSKMIKSHDFASTYVGTPFYMSPEICAAEKYTLKSDIWSLGCIIYELCAREPPFNAKTHFQLIQKIKEGRTAPLPDVYSPELGQTIRECLKVNPDKRPDTASLLQLPIMKLMRKEKEVVDLRNSLKIKEREVAYRMANLDKEKDRMREEIESSIRREWEVKARLEIDRLVNAEIDKLQRTFENEVQARVSTEIQRKAAVLAPLDTHFDEPSMSEHTSHHSSVGTSGDEPLSAATDMTEQSYDSPEPKEVKKSSRTPFARAQTMFAGHANTPMDIEMASPSPMAIASLSLSPRRNQATKAPTTHSGNIFAVNAAKNSAGSENWDHPAINESDDESDSELVPSPTRQVKSAKNPFTSKSRPILLSQKTAPMNQRKPQPSSGGLVSKVGLNPPESRSPRRLSKIPSAANLQAEKESHATAGGLTRANSLGRKDGNTPTSSTGSDGLGKVAAKNNIKGRTLVELQQARAGGRPLSAVVASSQENSTASPKRRVQLADKRRSSGGQPRGEPPAVWDPEKDDMPSPFLVRHRRAGKT